MHGRIFTTAMHGMYGKRKLLPAHHTLTLNFTVEAQVLPTVFVWQA